MFPVPVFVQTRSQVGRFYGARTWSVLYLLKYSVRAYEDRVVGLETEHESPVLGSIVDPHQMVVGGFSEAKNTDMARADSVSQPSSFKKIVELRWVGEAYTDKRLSVVHRVENIKTFRCVVFVQHRWWLT